MAPKLFVATKAFIIRDGKVLLVRESSRYGDGTQAGKFDVVGGRMDPGEHVEESLLREVKEETGLTVHIGKPFFVNESCPVVRGEPWQIVRIFFECFSESGAVRLGEDHDAYEWIDPATYAKYPIIENLIPGFETYLADRRSA